MILHRQVGWRQLVLGGAVFGLGMSQAGVALARPTNTIPECAKASLVESTIDPKKKAEAARKRRQVAALRATCEAKAAEPTAPSPTPQAKSHKSMGRKSEPKPAPVRPPTVQPRPQPRPVPVPSRPAPPPPHHKKRNLIDDLGGLLSNNAPPPSRPTRSAPRPRPVMAPAPAPAPPSAAPAPSPAAPVAYTPPAPQPPSPATSTTEQRNVFGVQLGEALSLPACAPGVINTSNPKAFDSNAKAKQGSVTASCAQTGPLAQTLAQRMADMEGKPVPSGVEFSLVRVAADRCPDWLSGSCTLSVAVKSGIALSVAFLTIEDAEPSIVRKLSSKYRGQPGTREAAACDVAAAAGAPAARRMGNDNTWKFADLSLSYWAVHGLNCGQGRVLVQTATWLELSERAMAGDGQPTM